MSNYSVISNRLCELGEGVYCDTDTEVIYWLDISNKRMFSSDNEGVSDFRLPECASAILDVDGELVTIASESGIANFSTKSNDWRIISPMLGRYSSRVFRANDGVKIDNNTFVYGVMNKSPETRGGAIVVCKDYFSRVVCDDISIPNTFVRIPGTYDLLISDSFVQKVYRCRFNEGWTEIHNKTVWLDLSNGDCVPDGGCISIDGFIFIALWDGFKVVKLNMNGEIIDEYLLPVPRPTNCILSKNEKILYVTSAYAGLSKSVVDRYPSSGSVFKVDLNG